MIGGNNSVVDMEDKELLDCLDNHLDCFDDTCTEKVDLDHLLECLFIALSNAQQFHEINVKDLQADLRQMKLDYNDVDRAYTEKKKHSKHSMEGSGSGKNHYRKGKEHPSKVQDTISLNEKSDTGKKKKGILTYSLLVCAVSFLFFRRKEAEVAIYVNYTNKV